jgi:hypothetical protein
MAAFVVSGRRHHHPSAYIARAAAVKRSATAAKSPSV